MLIDDARQLLVEHDWTQKFKATDADGYMVPIWDSRVRSLSLQGAIERAARNNEYSAEEVHDLFDRIQRLVLLENFDMFGGRLHPEPERAAVSLNNKLVNSKEEVLAFVDRYIACNGEIDFTELLAERERNRV